MLTCFVVFWPSIRTGTWVLWSKCCFYLAWFVVAPTTFIGTRQYDRVTNKIWIIIIGKIFVNDQFLSKITQRAFIAIAIDIKRTCFMKIKNIKNKRCQKFRKNIFKIYSRCISYMFLPNFQILCIIVPTWRTISAVDKNRWNEIKSM